jgi:Putative papain-like cysteine peptidase (DUF1796)
MNVPDNLSMPTYEPRYSIETVVEALYRGVLSRAPDEKGLLNNIRRLSLVGAGAAGLAPFVKDFLSSQEYQNRAARLSAQRLIAPSSALGDEPIDIVSLGSHCLVSYGLKEMGLKRYSCPFDWIFSRPSMIEHCIKDSFTMLTDRSQFQPVVDESGTELTGRCHHAFYRNSFGVERVFNHRDMRVKGNYEYLIRSIARFSKLLTNDTRKIFVLLSPKSWTSSEQFVSLHNTLSTYTSNFCLLFVILDKPQNNMCNFGIDHIERIGGSCLANMRPISTAGPLTFEDPFDDFMFRRAIVAFGVEARNPPSIEIKASL